MNASGQDLLQAEHTHIDFDPGAQLWGGLKGLLM